MGGAPIPLKFDDAKSELLPLYAEILAGTEIYNISTWLIFARNLMCTFLPPKVWPENKVEYSGDEDTIPCLVGSVGSPRGIERLQSSQVDGQKDFWHPESMELLPGSELVIIDSVHFVAQSML